MNTKQMKEAAQHDWFMDAFQVELGVWEIDVAQITKDKDGNSDLDCRTFKDFDCLRQWAGY